MDTVPVQPVRFKKQWPGYLRFVLLFLCGEMEMLMLWLAPPMPILPLIDISNGNEFGLLLFSGLALELSKPKLDQL